MKHGHTAGILKTLATLVLGGACAACAGTHSQATSSGDSASLGNHVPHANPPDVSGAALEQRNRDIVQSVTGRAM
jgi:ABC-type glycerol-3-phosphate transport system substrate-binding protein